MDTIRKMPFSGQGIKILLAATALAVLSGCAAPNGPLENALSKGGTSCDAYGCVANSASFKAAFDRYRYIGKPISVIYQKYGEPDKVENYGDGKIYTWVFDGRYTYNTPTGASRYGNQVTYHYRQAQGGHVLAEYYYTDRNGIIRDATNRYLNGGRAVIRW